MLLLWPHKCLVKENDLFAGPAGCALAGAAQEAISHQSCQGTVQAWALEVQSHSITSPYPACTAGDPSAFLVTLGFWCF